MLLQCPHSLLSTAVLPYSISLALQVRDLLLGQSSLLSFSIQAESDKQMCINMHQLSSKKSIMFCIWVHWMLIYHGWDLNGVFGSIILNCIIRNYGPYAMRLWQLRGHSHLYEESWWTRVVMGQHWGSLQMHIYLACQLTSSDSQISMHLHTARLF